jgi:hemerythrin
MSPLVTWDPSYSVKVKRCDEDHKKLFALINNLHEAMSVGQGADKVGQIVKELANYTRYHFSAEEALLEKAKYPDVLAHRAEHQVFVKKVDQFQKDIESGKGGQSIAVASFLKDWLTHHIKQRDQKYSAHLNANGIS